RTPRTPPRSRSPTTTTAPPRPARSRQSKRSWLWPNERNRAMSDVQQRAAEVIEACQDGMYSYAPGTEVAAALAAAGLLVDDDTAEVGATHVTTCRRCHGRGTWYPPDEFWHE